MNKLKFKNLFIVVLTTVCITTVGCSDDDDPQPQVEVTVNGSVLFDNEDDFNGDIDGSFTSKGGSDTRIFTWQNSLSTADYNADITATSEGSFNMLVADADGTIVLDRSLNGASEPDSFSGVTSSGVSGIWTVTITLNSFNGDGSFSLSEGN
ncbi:hypothetical protein [Winogradskyella ursingii]|uniref:hypothetical protein n=1 Tax=Winogradskyella ursingii TaxID=2686079 RepID=UPI0015C91160|nr:hypothetical protein [Winogradskyella ursingii]